MLQARGMQRRSTRKTPKETARNSENSWGVMPAWSTLLEHEESPLAMATRSWRHSRPGSRHESHVPAGRCPRGDCLSAVAGLHFGIGPCWNQAGRRLHLCRGTPRAGGARHPGDLFTGRFPREVALQGCRRGIDPIGTQRSPDDMGRDDRSGPSRTARYLSGKGHRAWSLGQLRSARHSCKLHSLGEYTQPPPHFICYEFQLLPLPLKHPPSAGGKRRFVRETPRGGTIRADE